MRLPLEDEFGDVLRKAMLGTRAGAPALSRETGIDAATIESWARCNGRADEAQARAMAPVLALEPQRFADSAAERWYPQEPPAPKVRRHSQHPHPSNGYVFSLDAGGAILVDPAGAPAKLLDTLRAGGHDVRCILITHKHADHCDATREIATAFPNAQIAMHRLDVHAIGPFAERAVVLDSDETIQCEGTTIRALHTPGHTDGSVCYLVDSTIFTGDILFAGSVGGAYGDKSTYADILSSIASKIFTLPDDTVIMPGHGPSTTLRQERAHNPFFS